MPCEPIIRKGKLVGFDCDIHEGKPKRPPCYKCGKPSTKLCDHRKLYIRRKVSSQGKLLQKERIPSIFTCDRPMCSDCANHYGEDLDYCDKHNDDFSRESSAMADKLYQKKLREFGVEEDE